MVKASSQLPAAVLIWARSCAALVLSSIAISVIARINLHIIPGVTWFPVFLLFICVGICRTVERHVRSQTADKSKSDTREVIVVVFAPICLIALGLAVSGLSNVKRGMVVLAGDQLDAPSAFRLVYSLVA
jgi:hypothetical protein